MKGNSLKLLIVTAMVVQSTHSFAQYQVYNSYQMNCPYDVTPGGGVDEEVSEEDETKQVISDAKSERKRLNKERREAEKELEALEESISAVVSNDGDPSMYSRVLDHMKNKYSCCKGNDVRVGAFKSEFLDYINASSENLFANYTAAFEESVELPQAVTVETIAPVYKYSKKADRLPATENPSKKRKKVSRNGDKPPTAAPAPVPIERAPARPGTTTAAPAPASVPTASGPRPDGTVCTPGTAGCPQVQPAPVSGGCPSGTTCTASNDCMAKTDRVEKFKCICTNPDPKSKQWCDENRPITGSSPNSNGGGVLSSVCSDENYLMGFNTNKFIAICAGPGKIKQDVCTSGVYQVQGVDKRAISKCRSAIRRYPEAAKRLAQIEKDIDANETAMDEAKSYLADLKREAREDARDGDDSKLESNCPTCAAIKARTKSRQNTSLVKTGLIGALAALGAYGSYKAAKGIARDNIRAGWPSSPYLATQAIYPFVQAGIMGMMGGVNGAFGCSNTMNGYPMNNPWYNQNGNAFNYPQSYYPYNSVYMPGNGPWQQASVPTIGANVNFNPYNISQYNPYSMTNPYSMYPNMNQQYYDPSSSMLSAQYQAQMAQMQAQQMQQYAQMQAQAAQTAAQKAQVQASLMQQMSRIQLQLQNIYSGGYSNSYLSAQPSYLTNSSSYLYTTDPAISAGFNSSANPFGQSVTPSR